VPVERSALEHGLWSGGADEKRPTSPELCKQWTREPAVTALL